MVNKEPSIHLLDELKDNFEFASKLTPEQGKLLLKHGTLEVVPADTVLIEKIGLCPGLGLILSGELRVSKISDDGREVTIYRVSKGRVCPLSAVCVLGGNINYNAKVIAPKPTRIFWVSKDFAQHSMALCEPLWRFLFQCLATRLFEAMEVVDSIAFISVKKRLAKLLMTNNHQGTNILYITHDALARELGTAREVVSRELKWMERQGIVKLSRGRISIENPKDLSDIANNQQ